jgi:hypothetical protein
MEWYKGKTSWHIKRKISGEICRRLGIMRKYRSVTGSAESVPSANLHLGRNSGWTSVPGHCAVVVHSQSTGEKFAQGDRLLHTGDRGLESVASLPDRRRARGRQANEPLVLISRT